jgi:hypothetical protein
MKPRFSLLTIGLLTAIAAISLVIYGQYSEIAPLRSENKRLNEERGTLVVDDKKRLCAIKMPDQFAGPDRDAYRVYVPEGQSYIAYVKVNGIPKEETPDIERLPDRFFNLGLYKEVLFARLEAGEWTLAVETKRLGGRRDIALMRGGPDYGFLLDASAQTPQDQWPTTRPDTYTIFEQVVERETTYADGSGCLVLLRRRIQGVARESLRVTSYRTEETSESLDGVMLWLERLP